MSDLGCRFIAGDPTEIIGKGESIYCNRPISRAGEAWCKEHRLAIYPPGLKWGDEEVNPPANVRDSDTVTPELPKAA